MVRIEITDPDKTVYASGFIVRFRSWPCLCTNNHVLRNREQARAAKLRWSVDYLQLISRKRDESEVGVSVLRLNPDCLWWTSEELDATLVAVIGESYHLQADCDRLLHAVSLSDHMPRAELSQQQRVEVYQHPRGRELHWAEGRLHQPPATAGAAALVYYNICSDVGASGGMVLASGTDRSDQRLLAMHCGVASSFHLRCGVLIADIAAAIPVTLTAQPQFVNWPARQSENDVSFTRPLSFNALGVSCTLECQSVLPLFLAFHFPVLRALPLMTLALLCFVFLVDIIARSVCNGRPANIRSLEAECPLSLASGFRHDHDCH